MRRALSASQLASSPSPSEVARPMPVIQTSAGPAFEDFVSVMKMSLLRKADTPGHGIHVSAQIRIGEGDVAERDGRVASQLPADLDPCFGQRITRTFVKDVGVDRQQFSGRDEAAHLGLL